ncbi:MAG: HAD-IA family hydrolase [Ferrimonas sp.]
MSYYSGVLFDLDGTLLDTAADLGCATNHALKQFGYPPISLVQAYQHSSYGSSALLQAGLGPLYSRTDITPLRKALLDYYRANLCIETRPYTGVVEVIQWLNQQQIPWGVVTNKPAWLTEPLLAQMPIFELCHCIVSGDTLPVAKPDPAPLLLAAQQLNLPTTKILYVGDAERDIEAGRRAGMETAVALWGFLAAEDQPECWQATHLLHQISDLTALWHSKA